MPECPLRADAADSLKQDEASACKGGACPRQSKPNLRPSGRQSDLRTRADPGAPVQAPSVGLGTMTPPNAASGTEPIPPAATTAALETFATLARARHPGVSLLPLRRVGTNGPVVVAATGQVIRPFAAPEDRDADAGVRAADDHSID
jgi:hypothetical protein